jgi:ribonucleoside-diphosphate reductase alpha chain
MLAQTSSGIEPVFLLSYKRRRKVNAEDASAKVDFTDDMGDHWQEFTVYHPKLKEWMKATKESDLHKNPYHGSTSSEIDWLKRVAMQSVVQKYTTHSISSTINLPNDVTTQTVGEIYMQAWKKGLKGITVYRDGSRSGVLVADADQNAEIELKQIAETKAPKRPKKLKAEIIRFRNNNEKWIAVVGLLDDKPYEIFTGKAEETFILPEWVEKGWVIKSKKGKSKSRYDFRYIDKDGYKVTFEGLSRSFNEEYWNYAKLISGVLRHGMPLPYVVHLVTNLDLHDSTINTWKNGVERALKKFIPDGTSVIDHKCPKCADPDGLIYEEGCLKCKSCGHSKCG